MRLILCDDEKAQVALLRDYAEAYGKAHGVPVDCTAYHDCDTLWWDLQDGLSADLLMLDIQMAPAAGADTITDDADGTDKPGGADSAHAAGNAPLSGIDLAHRMREAKMSYPVCFVTGIRDYVFEGYEVDAIGYLLKPYEKEQVFRILDKAVSMMTRVKRDLFLQSGGERIRIDAEDLIALEASAHETLVYLKNTEEPLTVKQGFRSLVDDVESTISGAASGQAAPSPKDSAAAPAFLTQIHRSYAVNMKHILRLTKDSCVAEGGLFFPIARGERDRVTKAFIAANKETGGLT